MRGTIRIVLGLVCFMVAAGVDDSLPFATFAAYVLGFGLGGALLMFSGAVAAEDDVSH